MHLCILGLKNTLMSSKRKLLWIGSAFLIALLFLLFYRLPVIEIAGEDASYYIREDAFELGWIHSIEKEEWFERYERKDGFLLLSKTYFKTFGAGTPYGGLTTKTEDGFIQMDLDIEYEELRLTISENVHTTLFFDDREVPLYDYFDQYETVVIKTTHISIWEFKRGDFL